MSGQLYLPRSFTFSRVSLAAIAGTLSGGKWQLDPSDSPLDGVHTLEVLVCQKPSFILPTAQRTGVEAERGG